MAQVIKLKRSAVAGKTPQTSSLELGELGINTSDGKIYFHRSSSSDDSIQSVLTTDATITGSLKLSGSQHLSGSLNVMDDLTYGGNLTASLGSTSSFDRITSVGTSSIGFLIASGSNFATFTDQTGSFASGSDVQQLLAESASYVVSTNTGSFLQNSDTASLGKVTLVSDITGSITSTASFGKLLGDASELSNLPESFTSAMISGSFQGGGSNLISGSILSTGSFGKLVVADLNYPINDGTDGQALITDGSGVLTFDDIKSVAIVKNISGTTLEKGTPVHATGSVGNIPTVIAASASDATTMPATFVLDEQLVDDAEGKALLSGFINGVNTAGFVEGGIVYVGENGGYTQTKPTGTNLIQNLGIVTKVDANGSGYIYGSGRSNDVPNLLNDHIFFGSGSNQMQQIHISGAIDQSTLNNINLTGDISSSITSTASFGLFVGDGSGLSNVSTETSSFASGSDVQGILDTYASGSDLQIILAESASYLNNDTTSSFGAVNMNSTLFVQGDITTSGSVVAQQFRTEFVSESIIFASGSTRFGDSSDDKHRYTGSIEITGNISSSFTSTGSFGNLKLADFGGLPFASGSDLHQILAESSSYVVESETGSFASGSDVQTILDDYAKGTEISGSYLGLLSGSNDLTLGGGISGSLISTASFGKILGDGSDLENVADPTAISGSYLGLLSGSDDLTLGGGVSGSIISTASFGLFVGDGAGLTNVSTDTTAFASGSDLHQILAESSSYVVESETGSFASGSDLHQILAESSSYLVNSDTASFATLDVVGNISSSASSTSSLGALNLHNTLSVSSQSGHLNGGINNIPLLVSRNNSITSTLGLVSTGSAGYSNYMQFLTSELNQMGSVGFNLATNNKFVIANNMQNQDMIFQVQDAANVSREALRIDASANRVGIYNSLPTKELVVSGAISASGDLFIDGINTTGTFTNTSGTLKVSQSVSDADIEISVNDGGTILNAITIDASAVGTVRLPNDSQQLLNDANDDLRLFHNGSHSFIQQYGTGDLYFDNTIDDQSIIFRTDDGSGGVTTYLKLDGSTSRVSIPSDSIKLTIGAGDDIKAYHDGTNSYITNATGNLIISQQADDENIDFKNDDGSGGVTTYIRLDGSKTKTTLLKDISGSLGTTGSFDRLEANTLNASISLFASGSDVSQIQAQSGSYATGSDLHQFLAESASYLVNSDTGSLGLLTLGNNITGSITSTGSFGRINAADKVFVDGRLGIGTELPAREFNVVSTQQVTSEFTSTNALGNLIDLVHENSAEGHNGFRFYDEGTQRMGLLHVQNGTRGYIHISNTYISGSEIFAVDGDNQNVIIGNHASKDEKLFVDGNVGMTGDLNVSGSITANEYIVNSSVTNVTQSFSSGSTIFGDSIDDTHKFTGSIELTGSTTIDGDESAINLTTDGIKKWQIVKNSDDDFKINRFGGGDDGSFVDQPFSISSGSGITTIN